MLKYFMRENQKNNHAVDPSKGGTGNASNPSIEEAGERRTGASFMDEKAETYIREAGNIEDMPDERDEQEREKADGQ